MVLSQSLRFLALDQRENAGCSSDHADSKECEVGAHVEARAWETHVNGLGRGLVGALALGDLVIAVNKSVHYGCGIESNG